MVTAFLFSCKKSNEEQEKRITKCSQSGEYDYLDNYKIDSLCTSELCSKYLEIWKELFKEKNNLNDDYFINHIQLCESEVNPWKNGISFRICYKIGVEWAIAYACDQFIIKINKDNHYYPALDLPRDEYLSKEKIRIAVENRAFSSNMTNLSHSDHLKFTSMGNAMSSLIKTANVNTLCMNMIYIDKTSGNITLEAWAEYENEENSCIRGSIDLITGKAEVTDTPCYIIN